MKAAVVAEGFAARDEAEAMQAEIAAVEKIAIQIVKVEREPTYILSTPLGDTHDSGTLEHTGSAPVRRVRPPPAGLPTGNSTAENKPNPKSPAKMLAGRERWTGSRLLLARIERACRSADRKRPH